MLIDDAAAAFRKSKVRYTIERSLVDRAKWVVKDPDGTRRCSGLGHTYEECQKMIADQQLKDGITAALQEMISVRVLTMAIINTGAPLASAKPFATALLPEIVKLAASEGNETVLQ